MKRLLYIGNKLSKHGFTPTSIETLGPFLEDEGYVVNYASSRKNQILRFLDMIFMVWKTRKSTHYIIIDTYSTWNFWYAVFVGIIAKKCSLRYLPILRGGDLPNRLLRNPRTAKKLFENAYVNIAPSKYLEYAFMEFGIKNIKYIPNSIEIKNYPFKEKKTDVPRLLWVRSFASIYNPKMAIDVLEKVKEIYPDATLTMVGPDKDGSLETARQYAISKKLNVNFTGRLSKKEWILLSEDYNVFINTTDFDNTPVSVIEAMALGLPIISTNVGGIPYLLEDNVDAILINPNDSEAMAGAVLKIINDVSLRNRLIEKGRQKAQTWDWEKVKLLWREVLK